MSDQLTGLHTGTSVDPLLGALLGSRYRIEAQIGGGGMGSVYRALDVRLGRRVAVKVLRDGDVAGAARFGAEVRVLAGLAHPNLVRLLDAGELDGRPYLVMELIAGLTLARALAGGSLFEGPTARLGAGIAAALAYVHGKGVVHRDLKPANILLAADGEAYLADFGIARLVDTAGMTVTGFTLGTPAYLAPEQVRGTGVGPAADVYALGLVLIECLTGRRAFEGTRSEVTAARLQRDPEIPAYLGRRWRELLASMTARSPDRRAEAGEVAALLEGAFPGGALPGRRAPRRRDAERSEETAPLSARGGTYDTVRLDPTPTAFALDEGPSAEPLTRRLTGRSAMRAGIGGALCAVLIGLGVGALFSGSPAARGAGSHAGHLRHAGHSKRSPSAEAPTSSSTTTTSTTSPPTVSGSVGGLVSTLEADVRAGTVGAGTARQLDAQLQPLLFSVEPAPAGQQAKQFDGFVYSFDHAVRSGLVAASAEGTIRREIGRLAAALRTTVPRATTEPTTTVPTTTTPGTTVPSAKAPPPTAPAQQAQPGQGHGQAGPGHGHGGHGHGGGGGDGDGQGDQS